MSLRYWGRVRLRFLLLAMQEEFKIGDTLLLDRTNGAGMTVRYLLPRTDGIQISLPFKSN